MNDKFSIGYRTDLDEKGGACDKNGIEDECVQDFGGNSTRKEATRKT
jgi:hypothetical protein